MLISRLIVTVAALVMLAGCQKVGSKSELVTSAAVPAAEVPVMLRVPAGVYTNDHLHTSLQWTVPHFETSHYTARFTKYEAVIILDPADITKSQVKLTIDPTSVRTDYPLADYKRIHGDRPFKGWDDELGTGDRWFNAGKFSMITFSSTKVERSGPRSAKVTGDLNFLGQTKPVVMDVTLVGQRAASGKRAATLGVHAEGEFDRTTYGMKVGAAGAPVKVVLDGEFSPKGSDDGN